MRLPAWSVTLASSRAIVTEPHAGSQPTPRADHAACADVHVRVDHAAGADGHIALQACRRVDLRAGMDARRSSRRYEAFGDAEEALARFRQPDQQRTDDRRELLRHQHGASAAGRDLVRLSALFGETQIRCRGEFQRVDAEDLEGGCAEGRARFREGDVEMGRQPGQVENHGVTCASVVARDRWMEGLSRRACSLCRFRRATSGGPFIADSGG